MKNYQNKIIKNETIYEIYFILTYTLNLTYFDIKYKVS